MANNKDLMTEFLNSRKIAKPSKRKFLKEDYIPSDKKSFSQKYGRRTTLDKNSENLIPEFVKKLFENENKPQRKVLKEDTDGIRSSTYEASFWQFGGIDGMGPSDDDTNKALGDLIEIANRHSGKLTLTKEQDSSEMGEDEYYNEDGSDIMNVVIDISPSTFTAEDVAKINEIDEIFADAFFYRAPEQSPYYEDDFDDDDEE